jgi:hypothetical protein
VGIFPAAAKDCAPDLAARLALLRELELFFTIFLAIFVLSWSKRLRNANS